MQALLDQGKAILLSLLTVIGVLTIFFTILGKVCKTIQDATDNVEIDGFLGQVILFCNKVSGAGLKILHIFPTWGTNPATKVLKDRLAELEAGNVNTEKANDQGVVSDR